MSAPAAAATLDLAPAAATASAAPSQVHGGPLLSVLMPVFNEQHTILQCLQRVLHVPLDLEVIVIDDGSTDDTPVRLGEITWPENVTVITHPRNQGKGAAIHTGLRHARGDYIVIQDADLEYNPLDLPAILQPLVTGQALAVYGSRYLHSGKQDLLRWQRWGVWGLNQLIRVLYGQRLTDCATSYKCLPTTLARSLNLRSPGFGFCPELTARLCQAGLRIVEVPVSYAPRSVKQGKKLRLRDGWEAARILWQMR